jgi:hypothetical protein
MFAIRKWTFKGVKEEEWLQAAVCDLKSRTMLPDELAESLVNAARLHGGDWLEAAHLMQPDEIAERLDQLEVHLAEAYGRASKRKQDENSDRLMFQLHGIEQHLVNRLRVLEATKGKHEELGRLTLAKATKGRIEKLAARMGLKREQVMQRERVIPDHTLVCAGLLRME